MRKQLQRAIDLASYTGDKIIFVDEKNDESLVVMGLDEYEKMVFGENKEKTEVENLTEEELLDKINREITLWKSVNEEDEEIEEEAQLDEGFLLSQNEKEVEIEPEEEEKDKELEKEAEDEEENLYYYEEAPAVPAAEAQENKEAIEEEATEEPEEKEEEKGFVSVGEELKNRNHWEIPKNIKNGAQEVK